MVDNQPISQLVYALQALAGDTATGCGPGHLVGDRSGAGLGGRHHRADPAVGYRGLPAETLMAVLVGAAVDAEAYSEKSLRAPAVAHRGCSPSDCSSGWCATPMTHRACADPARGIPAHAQCRLRRLGHRGHRRERAVPQRATGGAGRDDVRIDDGHGRHQRRASRRVPGPAVGAAGTSRRRPAVAAGSPKSFGWS